MTTICHYLFNTTKYPILQTARNSVLFICSFTFSWFRIRNYNSGSGSRPKFRIHADPDPQGSGSTKLLLTLGLYFTLCKNGDFLVFFVNIDMMTHLSSPRSLAACCSASTSVASTSATSGRSSRSDHLQNCFNKIGKFSQKVVKYSFKK